MLWLPNFPPHPTHPRHLATAFPSLCDLVCQCLSLCSSIIHSLLCSQCRGRIKDKKKKKGKRKKKREQKEHWQISEDEFANEKPDNDSSNDVDDRGEGAGRRCHGDRSLLGGRGRGRDGVWHSQLPQSCSFILQHSTMANYVCAGFFHQSGRGKAKILDHYHAPQRSEAHLAQSTSHIQIILCRSDILHLCTVI